MSKAQYPSTPNKYGDIISEMEKMSPDEEQENIYEEKIMQKQVSEMDYKESSYIGWGQVTKEVEPYPVTIQNSSEEDLIRQTVQETLKQARAKIQKEIDRVKKVLVKVTNEDHQKTIKQYLAGLQKALDVLT